MDCNLTLFSLPVAVIKCTDQTNVEEERTDFPLQLPIHQTKQEACLLSHTALAPTQELTSQPKDTTQTQTSFKMQKNVNRCFYYELRFFWGPYITYFMCACMCVATRHGRSAQGGQKRVSGTRVTDDCCVHAET